VRVGDRQDVEFLAFADSAERFSGLLMIARQQLIHQQETIAVEPNHVVDGCELVEKDFPRGVQVGLHLGLGLINNPVTDNSDSNNAKGDTREQDDEQEA